MGFRVNVTADLDIGKWQARVERATEAMAVQAMVDTDQFVPMQSGNLTNMSRVEDGDKIVYLGPYAQYLYHGKLMVDPKTGSSYARKGSTKTLTSKPLNVAKSNPMAQPEWFEASKSVNLEKWKRVFAKEVTRG